MHDAHNDDRRDDPEDDGFGHERSDPEDYPYGVDRRYHPHPVGPIGAYTVDDLAGGRGAPDPEGDADLIEPGEMACLLKGRSNATQVLIDQGPELGAMTNSLTASFYRARAALDRFREAALRNRDVESRGLARIKELEERFAHVPPERRLPPRAGFRAVVTAAIVSFALLDMWFFHKFVATFWKLSTETELWQIRLFGPLLGLLVALLVWVSGRLLGTRIWYLRADLAGSPERPGTTRPDGRPRSWYARAAQGGWWRLRRAARVGLLPLSAVLLGVWTLAVVGVFGYYRAMDDLTHVPNVSVAGLIVTLGLGAMLLEAIAQNPFADAVASARHGVSRARHRARAASKEVTVALSELTQYSDGLRRRRDEAMGLARIEMDRAWNTAILPSRHRSGRSGAAAPDPAPLERIGQGVHRLSRVPDDREIEAFFRTFDGIPVPPPALGPVSTADHRLSECDPVALRKEFEVLVERLAPNRAPNVPAPEETG